MLLADLGAEVIKIERPDKGDVYRDYGPKFINGVSTSFLGVNRNKKSVAVDLKCEEGREIIGKLVSRADVLVENFKLGTMEKLHLDYQKVKKNNPRLIYCSISGFGRTGPYKDRGGFDLILQGMSGIMSITGDSDRSPAKVGVPITDIGAAIFSAIGILAALLFRVASGKGQFIDASLLEAGLGFTVLEAVNYFADGEIPERLGSASRQNAPYQAFQTKDGYVNVGTGNEQLWRRFCEVLQLQRLVDDPRFDTNALRVRHQRELAAEITPTIKSLSTRECLDLFNKAGIPSGPIYNIGEAFQDPQTRDRGMVVEYEHPLAGIVRNIGFPVKFSEMKTSITRNPPLLGEHTLEVLRSIDYGEDEINELNRGGIVKIS
jgi:crotonobetainyl-CoA:carnitine CoA-transferase CaiB-like acyl-CoA transferase